jgi:hypothetical protein
MSLISSATPLAELIRIFSGYPEHMAVVRDDIAALDAALQVNDGDINCRMTHDCHDETPLTLAIRLQRTNVVEHLLNRGARANSNRPADRSFADDPFAVAAQCGNERIMTLMMEADRDFVASHASQVLCCAADNADTAVLATLLAAGLPHDPTSDQQRLLNAAASNENEQAISLLLASGWFPDDANVNELVELAAANRNEQVLAKLIAVCADRQRPSINSESLIHTAAQNPNAKVLRLLLANGVDVNVVDQYNENALTIACSNPNEQVLEALLEAGATFQRDIVCFRAAENTNATIMRRVIESGVDLSARDRHGHSPLHIAAATSTVEVVSLLLEAGADINAMSDVRKTTLEFACANKKNSRVLSLLLAAGALIQRVPLLIESAINVSNLDALRILAGAGVDVAREFITTPRLGRCAARWATVAMLECLIGLGVSICEFCEAFSDGKVVGYETSEECLAVLFAHGALHLNDSALERTGHKNFVMFTAAGIDFKYHECLSDWSRALLAVVDHPLSALDRSTPLDRRELAAACNRLAERQFQLLRMRAFQVCVGLQSQRLPALVSCEILSFVFGARESLVPFHRVWAIVTKIKHFH